MEHPQALHDAGKSGPVVRFARNKMCALAKPLLKVDAANLVTRMLDPAVKLGISTPKADPSGDYAIEIFRKAEAVKAGARGALEKKALQLTGSATSAQPPRRPPGLWLAARGRQSGHLPHVLHQCDGRKEAKPRPADHRTCPDNLSVGAAYGLTVIDGAPPAAQRSCQFHRLAGRRGDPCRLWLRAGGPFRQGDDDDARLDRRRSGA